MTLTETEALDKDMLISDDVAPYLEVDPANLRWQAQHEPEKLGFPVVVRSRVKIPKDSFVYFCRYGRRPLEDIYIVLNTIFGHRPTADLHVIYKQLFGQAPWELLPRPVQDAIACSIQDTREMTR